MTLLTAAPFGLARFTAAPLAAAPPAVDRDTGRQWLERELSRAEYSANDLTLLERIGRWIDETMTGLLSAALSGNSPWLLLLVVLAVAAIIALIVWRVRVLGLRRAHVPLAAFDAVVASPEPGPWRESAEAAAAAGDHRRALVDRSRAIFAVLGARRIVDLESASTATEIAVHAAAVLPSRARQLNEVATVFNDLVFGRGSARDRTPEELRGLYAEFSAFDAELTHLPVPQPAGGRR